MIFINRKESAFGLDISNRNLRLVQLEKKGKKNIVRLYNEVELPVGCINEGEIIKPEVFLDALKKLIKTRKGRGKLSDSVITVLPESKTFLKIIEIETAKKETIEEEIKSILPKHLPLDINDSYLDWQIVKKNETNLTVLIGASPKKLVDSYVEIISKINLMPIIMEIEAAAISRVLISEEETKSQIIIDIGANRTGLFLYDEGTVKFTISLPISGNKINELISQSLDMDLEQSEKAKIVCGLDSTKCHGALLEIFSDTVKELSDHIKEAIKYYENTLSLERPIEKIILCGGGANFINISQILQSKLNIPVEVSYPWKDIVNPNKNYFTDEKSQSFVTALGLGLRGINPKTFL